MIKFFAGLTLGALFVGYAWNSSVTSTDYFTVGKTWYTCTIVQMGPK